MAGTTRVSAFLFTQMPPVPYTLHVIRYNHVVSTNQIALELGDHGAQHGTLITAVEQSGGRGRLGRSFSSPPGGLYFSLILRPKISPDRLSLLTLAAGVACSTVVEGIAGQGVKLKWPNDLYLENRKLGGILCESAAYSVQAGKVPFLVVGIGLNINTDPEQFPIDLRETVISLCAVRKKYYDLDSIMQDIAGQIIGFADNPERIQQVILDEFRQRDYLYRRKIRWHGADGREILGVGSGLLRDGRYALQTAEGDIVPILGGELSILDGDKGKS